MKVCDRQKGEMCLLEWGILQYLHLKARKSKLKLPHQNMKVCLFHKEGIPNIKSTGTTFIFDEKTPVCVSTSREAGEGALLTEILVT